MVKEQVYYPQRIDGTESATWVATPSGVLGYCILHSLVNELLRRIDNHQPGDGD